MNLKIEEIKKILYKIANTIKKLEEDNKERLMKYRETEKVVKKAYEDLEELVERDTPKKIEYDDFEEPCCPDCGEVQCTNVYATNNCFCPYCGQRLDWSDWSE